MSKEIEPQSLPLNPLPGLALHEQKNAGTWEVSLRDPQGAVVLAASLTSPARSLTDASVELRVEKLSSRDSQKTELLSLLYCAGRRARLEGMRLAQIAPSENSALLEDVLHPMSAQGISYVRLDESMCSLGAKLEEAGAAIPSDMFVAETREAVLRWLEPGESWGFFKSVLDGTLTRDQYVYAISNVHQFVRHTTRILGRCIAHSDTTEGRKHFINHLNGEVNHEIIIEKDLAHLGASVEFVKNQMSPNLETLEFMAVQESAIGYYDDPSLLVASPLAAEGVTAHMSEAFMEKLNACIGSWGIEQPEKASQFFSSHMTFDGGMDGHWEGTLVYLRDILKTEHQFQRFMTTCRASMGSTERMYGSFTRDIPA